MNVTRSAPQGAHYHVDVIYLLQYVTILPVWPTSTRFPTSIHIPVDSIPLLSQPWVVPLFCQNKDNGKMPRLILGLEPRSYTVKSSLRYSRYDYLHGYKRGSSTHSKILIKATATTMCLFLLWLGNFWRRCEVHIALKNAGFINSTPYAGVSLFAFFSNAPCRK